MNNTAERIKALLRDAGVEERQIRRELAETCGISVQAVGDWFKGSTKKISPEHLASIAQRWGTTTDYLITGRQPGRLQETVENVEPYDADGKIPLISWVSAGAWCESPDEFAPGDAEEWLPLPSKAGPRSFALRVDGDSMTAPYPGVRSYPHGTIIYVDPDREVANGCRVVARTPDGHYTFKTYAEDAGRQYLKPINPQYAVIDITRNVHICGVVIGSYLPE